MPRTLDTKKFLRIGANVALRRQSSRRIDEPYGFLEAAWMVRMRLCPSVRMGKYLALSQGTSPFASGRCALVSRKDTMRCRWQW